MCSSDLNFSAVMALLTPVMLIGGMTMGVFTPTEGAIAASMWALFLGLVWYRTLDWRRLVKLTMDTIETTATVLFIVAAASIFGWLLTVTRVTDAVAEWVQGHGVPFSTVVMRTRTGLGGLSPPHPCSAIHSFASARLAKRAGRRSAASELSQIGRAHV